MTPRPESSAPKHSAARHAAPRASVIPAGVAQAPRLAARTTVVVSALAVGTTGAAVAGGVGLAGGTTPVAAADTATTQSVGLTAADLLTGVEETAAAAQEIATEDRGVVSRSADRRADTDDTKVAILSSDGEAMTRSEDSSDLDPRSIASAMLGSYGWDSSQFTCLDSLWTKESGWQVDADNPTSSAYGIPQALPGSKMASAGADWATNPVTQITWGLGYIQDVYGSPCSAWAHSQSVNWY
ncbi:lytic transglycosylase domain-containing protein [Nocardioides bruguierae]|uniref:Lytic transglycosylase domain-containing protein n=1 Tax=Nocardioides bruguierae TaxID=2945102 RepID=A0A9X2IFN2_9ACTN|nr:lytic transglycosylase domain-containing protein [Nocardioides bruguierae]MCL8025808.1 lytic transglycosylase domain-containing protein [Nocardioides bruguierae]MCM0622011.1 lytic transglycosylase domain-containing protein [Nocardioides bruguierae]